MAFNSIWKLIKSVSIPVLKRSTLWNLSDEILTKVAEGRVDIGQHSQDNGLPHRIELARQIMLYHMKLKAKNEK